MSCMSGPCRHGNILHITLCITRGDGPICLGAAHLTLFSVIGSYLASNFSSVLNGVCKSSHTCKRCVTHLVGEHFLTADTEHLWAGLQVLLLWL